MNEDNRTTISLSKKLFAEFKRLRKLYGYTTEGFIERLLKLFVESKGK